MVVRSRDEVNRKDLVMEDAGDKEEGGSSKNNFQVSGFYIGMAEKGYFSYLNQENQYENSDLQMMALPSPTLLRSNRQNCNIFKVYVMIRYANVLLKDSHHQVN